MNVQSSFSIKHAFTEVMYPAGNLFIPAPHGRLEAILKEPRVEPRRGAALVLHPHPLGGGTMHNKVVFRASSALNDAGLLTLRLNFRGVGLSTGLHDEGRGETEDARAGLDYLDQNYRSGRGLTLAGFSFGSRVGMEVGLRDERVAELISIGTPVDKYDFSFVKDCRKPILFVHGDRDEFGRAAAVRALAESLPAEARAAVRIIANADHFFEGRLDEMKRIITEWMEERMSEQQANALAQ